MCLADVACVVAVDPTSGTAEVDRGGRVSEVSLAPLVLTGVTPEVGDWLVVHTGLAVELLEEVDARRIADARGELAVHDTPDAEPADAKPADGGARL